MAAKGGDVAVGARAVALATGARVFTVASVGNGAAPESQAARIKPIAKSHVIASVLCEAISVAPLRLRSGQV